MRTLLNPKWLWLLNTLPLLVLLTLLRATYDVIHTLLPAESQHLWQWFGGVLVLLGGLHAGYATWQWRRRATLSGGYAVVALVAYTAFLYIYCYHLSGLIPFDLPRWMVAGDLPLYVGTFLMPTLAHAVAVLVLRLTPEDKERSPLPSFGAALAVPVAWYVFAQLVLPLWQVLGLDRVGGGLKKLGLHGVVVMIIAGTLIFLLFLARGVYILASRRAGRWGQYQWAWKVLITGLLPLLGLAINNGQARDYLSLGVGTDNFFGDFDGPWWYGLAVLNAGLLCVPTPTKPRVRLALYLGRGITLSYTFYFFLVFLPLLPLSVVAVIAIGVGFLLLTPLALFIVHVRELAQDYAMLRGFFSGRVLALGLAEAAAVLPLGITLHYYHHRMVLHEALDYVYAPDYARSYRPIDAEVLGNTLQVIDQYKTSVFRPRPSFTGARVPYLSAYFNWLVLDNLTLSEEKITTLKRVFWGSEPSGSASGTPVSRSDEETPTARPTLTQLAARSHYDARQRAWVSWLDLTITNSHGSGSREYATTFGLPAGCFISDYYLDINGRREPGILAEKRAAAWVYSQIRNESRDPGLLQYVSGNRVALRMFPIAAGEIRFTGIQLLHKEPLRFRIDDHTVALGHAATPPPAASTPAVPEPTSAVPPVPGVAYVTAAEKATLPVVRRQPYYHFLVDMSAGKARYQARYQCQIDALVARQHLSGDDVRVSLVGTYVTTLPAASRDVNYPAAGRYEGGFYLDRAIRQILVQAAEQPQNRYPLIVVVSADFNQAILPDNFADLRHAYPESDTFYELLEDGQLVPHSLDTESISRTGPALTKPTAAAPVVAWPDAQRPAAYLPANGQPDFVLATSHLDVPEAAIRQRDWQSGLLLQGLWRARLHHPATTAPAEVSLIQHSFRSGILTPLTAYLSLENEAQKAALRRKQEQMLNGHRALDAGEEAQRMSEPGEWLLLLAGAILSFRWLRQRKARLARSAS
ncbi:MSEP-CTERM sorting domain-containing protein [Hymenobacter sp. BT664]|uniref:MSEP-CTERM sorting domain-containing protein n=1 Tax=Hymenobacter montanus TaxID=2771359 RepID=A0A927BEJ5_9BACT|nr:MSEP-CTERM sorting domain-containing protein [Hymenobacter montanus]MBD2768931.1 MSEP-CTERM sorting domain-containing protein [Hymenobacter montanus]